MKAEPPKHPPTSSFAWSVTLNTLGFNSCSKITYFYFENKLSDLIQLLFEFSLFILVIKLTCSLKEESHRRRNS